jgi:eukaryotic-like serine/threonine-protein kinase
MPTLDWPRMKELTAGTVLAERYLLHEAAGEGGMATVWHATDQVLDRPVAVKILHPNLAEDPALLERFRAEALAAARLNHPNIVNVFDAGSEDHAAYIVMEMFEGETMRDRLRREGHLPPDAAVTTILQVLSALHFAHENGLIHRDVKPANILLGTDGRVKVTDFGIAKAAYESADPTTTGSVLGSVPYLSPEQVEGKPIDGRSDVYSAGATLYEALTGRPPFEAETNIAAAVVRLTKDPPPPRALRPGIPRPLEAIVMRALARDPNQRFASADDMCAALARLDVAPAPSSLPSDPPGPAMRLGVFRSWMLIPLIAILAAGVAILVGLLVGALQVGGPLGIRPKEYPSSTVLKAARVTAFDPLGDGQENDDLASLSTDKDPGTFWQTENYEQLDLGGTKPGVGLLFALGKPANVTGFRLITPFPGYDFQVKVGGTRAALVNKPGPKFRALRNMREDIPPVTGRFVLLWINDVVPTDTGNRATVAEFRILGHRG